MLTTCVLSICLCQVHIEVPPLPRMPELCLEAGAALLMAQRPTDCMALCDEVISSMLELLPERLVLEEPEENSEAETTGCAEGEGKAEMLLWTASAYLLQGHCYVHLKDWKQSVTHYTRFVRLIFKFCLLTNIQIMLVSKLQVYQPAGEGSL